MDLAAARLVLGVTAATPWPEVRAVYLRLVRDHHPDIATDLADAGIRTLRTAQITEAFSVVVEAQTAAPESVAAPTPKTDARAAARDTTDGYLGASFRHPTIAVDGAREVLLDAPVMEAFLALHEVFSMLGAVSYIDRLSLVLEAIVVPVPGQATSLLTWLDPAPNGATAATICVESLGGHPPADIDTLVDRIADLLAAPRPPADPD
ncbi:MAG: hypothetical protein ABIP21_01820 [Acidimicrobiia bacterium]